MVDYIADHSAAREFAELATELHDTNTVEETVEAVVQFALRAVNVEHAGVVLATRDTIEISAVSDPLLDDIYRAKIAHGEGPLLDALRSQTIVQITDVATEPDKPWRAMLLEHGIRSILHLPLGASERTIGVLSLYCETPNAFSEDEIAVGDILARHASLAVASARHEETLAKAIDARKAVGMAMGMLMLKYDLDEPRAFAVLQRYSQDHNRKLRVVAQEVIDTRKLPT
ncbi:GAF and ANTAR domain-containing protein [Kribbella deserti]|uniref:GAF and ANTAR domain-containing protein n=1 Tax=Kribbella deserti TaxID=1926257 RepID=A0ABV6QFS3_9ACTN